MTRIIDPTRRTELTGPWAGFGFQQGHFWTPEGCTLFPEDMRWWSLTCNIAQEWRRLMKAQRHAKQPVLQGGIGRVIQLRARTSALSGSLQAARTHRHLANADHRHLPLGDILHRRALAQENAPTMGSQPLTANTARRRIRARMEAIKKRATDRPATSTPRIR